MDGWMDARDKRTTTGQETRDVIIIETINDLEIPIYILLHYHSYTSLIFMYLFDVPSTV